jgi:hypothetical protein
MDQLAGRPEYLERSWLCSDDRIHACTRFYHPAIREKKRKIKTWLYYDQSRCMLLLLRDWSLPCARELYFLAAFALVNAIPSSTKIQATACPLPL